MASELSTESPPSTESTISPSHSSLLAILLAAALLRLACLGSNPSALFRDEAEKGYTAWSFAKLGGYTHLDPATGRPIFIRMPLFVHTPGALTSAAYQYIDAPFTGLLGPSEFAIRLPAALAGIATVGFCYLLTLALFGDRRTALAAAALLAVSPWHVLFSRWAAQGILAPLFVTLAMWLFWRSARENGGGNDPPAPGAAASWLWLAAALAVGLAAYSYAPARLSAPLIAAAAGGCGWRAARRRPVPALAALAVLLTITVPLVVFQLTTGAERFGRVSIFGGEEAGGSPFAAALILARNYFSHFSPFFLFFGGDAQPRHSLPFFGQMLHIEGILFPIGLFVLARRRRPEDLFVLAWLLTGPLPAALTREAPHALRSIAILPAPHIVSAVGAGFLARAFKSALAKRALVLLPALNAAALAVVLFRVYPVSSAPWWQYGLKQAFEAIDAQAADYGPPPFIALSAGIPWSHQLTLAYRRTDPARYRSEGLAATLPVTYLPPGPVSRWLERAPSGAWFVLLLGEWPSLGQPDDVVRFPGGPAAQPALLLYRKE